MDRDYFIPKCDVSAAIGDADTVGIFGEYKSLALETEYCDASAVLMQDLAGESAYDITGEKQ